MRVNWFRVTTFALVIAGVLYLAWRNEANLTLRGISLGEPDPMFFFFLLVIFAYPFCEWSLSMYLWLQYEREVGPIFSATNNRMSVHNTEPFDTVNPPRNYERLFEGAPPEHPELTLGQYSVYVGEGAVDLKLRGNGDTAPVAIVPTALTQKHEKYVDCMAHTESYIGLPRALDIPAWVPEYCERNIPGFVPFGTEIIFGDKVDAQAVLAWDERLGKAVWTRSVVEKPIDYQNRIVYLEDEVKYRTTENIALAKKVSELRKRKIKRQRPQIVAPPAPAQTGQTNGGDKNV